MARSQRGAGAARPPEPEIPRSPTSAAVARLPSRIDPDLNAEIEAWIAAQPMRPTKTSALEYLLRLGLKAAQQGKK